jgi:hypothetical protein
MNLHCCTGRSERRMGNGTEGLRESHHDGRVALFQDCRMSHRDGTELHSNGNKKSKLRSTEHFGLHDDGSFE